MKSGDKVFVASDEYSNLVCSYSIGGFLLFPRDQAFSGFIAFFEKFYFLFKSFVKAELS